MEIELFDVDFFPAILQADIRLYYHHLAAYGFPESNTNRGFFEKKLISSNCNYDWSE